MEDIKQVLQTVFKQLTDRQSAADFDKAFCEWQRIIGKRAGKHTKIVYLTKDKIQVNVDSSVWLHELILKKRYIQDQLKASLKIQKLILKLGDV